MGRVAGLRIGWLDSRDSLLPDRSREMRPVEWENGSHMAPVYLIHLIRFSEAFPCRHRLPNGSRRGGVCVHDRGHAVNRTLR